MVFVSDIILNINNLLRKSFQTGWPKLIAVIPISL